MQQPDDPLGAVLAEVLEIMPRAVAVMDEAGEILFRNAAAAGLPGDSFNPGVTLALRRAIPAVLERKEMRCLTRADLGRSAQHAVMMVPLRVRANGRRCVAMWILHHAFPLAPEADTLVRLFGLSRAEAKLCVSIVLGQSLAECARGGGITVATVRSQLNKIFAKTGVRRQAELVALLRRIPVIKTTRAATA